MSIATIEQVLLSNQDKIRNYIPGVNNSLNVPPLSFEPKRNQTFSQIPRQNTTGVYDSMKVHNEKRKENGGE